MTTRMLLAAATLFWLAPGVSAQELPPGTTPGVTPPAATGEEDDDTRDGYFSLVGGYESDTLDTTYAFLSPRYSHPLGEKTSLQFKVSFNYLSYEFESGGGGHTEVKSPGISPGIGLEYEMGRTDVSVSASIGFKDRERTIYDRNDAVVRVEEENDADLGVGASVYSNLTRRQVLHGIVSYNTADGYLWSRLAYKVQVNNANWRGPLTWHVGAEAVGQGNEDIKAYQGGGILEVTFARHRLSLAGRLGVKKATYDAADDRTGTYFGVNLYKRF